ncbi:MAG: ABC transporter ATP-binding protein [Proteobacteria bacterium]|nr:ABC transporter ATP-binding protein [Pseudomonadota bacterium]
MNVLELAGIERWYDAEGGQRVQVLRGVDLVIPAGKAIAIVGPSGSGKSTLLHVAGLLDKPNRGTVRLAGRDIAGLDDDAVAGLRNQACGFVYQFHHLLREFTALENVVMPARISGVVNGEQDKRALDLLEKVGLAARVGHYPSQLSGGEQQRVALARALMNNPQLLLADEPTGNLDPQTADEVVDVLFNLIEQQGMSALIVTHNMALANLCHAVYRMESGVLSE